MNNIIINTQGFTNCTFNGCQFNLFTYSISHQFNYCTFNRCIIILSKSNIKYLHQFNNCTFNKCTIILLKSLQLKLSLQSYSLISLFESSLQTQKYLVTDIINNNYNKFSSKLQQYFVYGVINKNELVIDLQSKYIKINHKKRHENEQNHTNYVASMLPSINITSILLLSICKISVINIYKQNQIRKINNSQIIYNCLVGYLNIPKRSTSILVLSKKLKELKE